MSTRDIESVFARCAEEKRAAFIPYLCGGDPDLDTTRLLLRALVDGGADLIEIGVPFSDPIADGPVNQRAAYRALDSGTTLESLLELIGEERESLGVPIVLFTYFNPIHAMGVQNFAQAATHAGVDGVLCVDVPPEEGEVDLLPALRQVEIAPVFLLAPTSSKDRIRQASESSGGFVYYVARLGVTGAATDVEGELGSAVKSVRKRSRLPVAVGFGISTPEQVHTVAQSADGVVVGSALVQLVEDALADGKTAEQTAAVLEARVRELCAGLAKKKFLGMF